MSAPSYAWRAAWSPANILLLVGATAGLLLLLVLALYRWDELGDSHAYWLAGRAVVDGRSPYELTTGPQVPFAYQYPPPMAQVMAPVAAAIGAWPFEYLWLALMGVCLAWLAGWRTLLALALVALLPVTIEFWYRNFHLQLAVLVVLAIQRWPALFAVGAAIKLSPGRRDRLPRRRWTVEGRRRRGRPSRGDLRRQLAPGAGPLGRSSPGRSRPGGRATRPASCRFPTSFAWSRRSSLP